MRDEDAVALNEALGIDPGWRPLSQRYPEHFPNRPPAQFVSEHWASNFERLVGRPPVTPVIPPHEHEWADLHGVMGCGTCRIERL